MANASISARQATQPKRQARNLKQSAPAIERRKAAQKLAERSNPLCGTMPADTISNCRQVIQFLQHSMSGDLNGARGFGPEIAMGLYMVHRTVIDALKLQEAAL